MAFNLSIGFPGFNTGLYIDDVFRSPFAAPLAPGATDSWSLTFSTGKYIGDGQLLGSRPPIGFGRFGTSSPVSWDPVVGQMVSGWANTGSEIGYGIGEVRRLVFNQQYAQSWVKWHDAHGNQTGPRKPRRPKEEGPEMPDTRDRVERYFNELVDPKRYGEALTQVQRKVLAEEEKADPEIQDREGTTRKLVQELRWIKGNAESGERFLEADQLLRKEGKLTTEKKLALLLQPTGDGEINEAAAQKIRGILGDNQQPDDMAISKFLPKLLEVLETYHGKAEAADLIADLYTYVFDYLQDEREIEVPGEMSATGFAKALERDKHLTAVEAGTIATALEGLVPGNQRRRALRTFENLESALSEVVGPTRREERIKLLAGNLLEAAGITNKGQRDNLLEYVIPKKKNGNELILKIDDATFDETVKRVRQFVDALRSEDAKQLNDLKRKYKSK